MTPLSADSGDTADELIPIHISLTGDNDYHSSSFNDASTRSHSPLIAEWVGVKAFSPTRTGEQPDYEGPRIASMELTEDTLARRALYDLWDNETNPGKKNEYKTLGYDTYSEARQFFISYSYNDYRPLNGKIAEARVWSVARTPEQIWENMYNVENPKDDPTLLGYWKFNDGKGNTVKDYSRYGNDGQAKYDLKWPDGIEIPKINEVEE